MLLFNSLLLPALFNPSQFKISVNVYRGFSREDIVPMNANTALFFYALSGAFAFLSMLSISLSWIKISQKLSPLFNLSFTKTIQYFTKGVYLCQMLFLIVLASLFIADYISSINLIVAIGYMLLILVFAIGRRRFVKMILATNGKNNKFAHVVKVIDRANKCISLLLVLLIVSLLAQAPLNRSWPDQVKPGSFNPAVFVRHISLITAFGVGVVVFWYCDHTFKNILKARKITKKTIEAKRSRGNLSKSPSSSNVSSVNRRIVSRRRPVEHELRFE